MKKQGIFLKISFISISILLVSIFIFLFTGCGTKTETTAAANTETATSTKTKTPESAGKELNIYVWEGYLPEQVAANFEKETGIHLNVTLVTDNGMMLTLLKGGGKADIVMPTQNQVNRFYEANLSRPLNLDNIPNYSNVSKALKEQPWNKWDGNKMGYGDVRVIPYVFGTSGIAVNTEKYKSNLDGLGWDVLLDKSLKGRVSSKNAAESLMICLDILGIPRDRLITDTKNTLEQARPKVLELKNNVLKFYDTGAEILDLLKNEEVWVSHIWDGGGRKLISFNSKFKYILPKTGGFGWTDTFMIPSSSNNPVGAEMFINFMLRPEVAAILTSESGYTTTVEGALEKATGIDKELYKISDADLAKLVWQPNFPEDVIAAYTDFWEEISTVK